MASTADEGPERPRLPPSTREVLEIVSYVSESLLHVFR